jgi:hypothetical protein
MANTRTLEVHRNPTGPRMGARTSQQDRALIDAFLRLASSCDKSEALLGWHSSKPREKVRPILYRPTKNSSPRRLIYLSLLAFCLLLVIACGQEASVGQAQTERESQPKAERKNQQRRLGSDSPILYKEAAEWPIQAL